MKRTLFVSSYIIGTALFFWVNAMQMEPSYLRKLPDDRKKMLLESSKELKSLFLKTKEGRAAFCRSAGETDDTLSSRRRTIIRELYFSTLKHLEGIMIYPFVNGESAFSSKKLDLEEETKRLLQSVKTELANSRSNW
ncbi:MAG: hypothetical protein LBQ08_00130 [Holosporaceae bacterium]|jgi:hypothetical protein|nr:hypothetical protein [Holosporaceae bacterium]